MESKASLVVIDASLCVEAYLCMRFAHSMTPCPWDEAVQFLILHGAVFCNV